MEGKVLLACLGWCLHVEKVGRILATTVSSLSTKAFWGSDQTVIVTIVIMLLGMLDPEILLVKIVNPDLKLLQSCVSLLPS